MHFIYRSEDERNHLGVMNSGNKHTKKFSQHTYFSPFSSLKTETKNIFWHLQEGESLKKRNHYRGNCISSIRFFVLVLLPFSQHQQRAAVIHYSRKMIKF